MPFFYVPGNHDVAAKAAAKFWEDKLGRRYYHFVYRNVLFLILNADDPPGSGGAIGKEQIAYAQKTLKENAERALDHRGRPSPALDASYGAKNGWGEVEKALKGRNYTVFAGHVHRYQKFVRQGMNYYQLATTGGSSLMRGVDYSEFDQLAWVTMKKDGPAARQHPARFGPAGKPENRQDRRNRRLDRQTPAHASSGRLRLFRGRPIAGAVVTSQRRQRRRKAKKRPASSRPTARSSSPPTKRSTAFRPANTWSPSPPERAA